jgi:hypothetical protein
MNYLAVRLKAGAISRPAGILSFGPPLDGSRSRPDEVRQGELVAFRPPHAAIEFEAQSDAESVLGSAVPDGYDLVVGSHSVHTSTEALREAEAWISVIQTRLIQHGRFNLLRL